MTCRDRSRCVRGIPSVFTVRPTRSKRHTVRIMMANGSTGPASPGSASKGVQFLLLPKDPDEAQAALAEHNASGMEPSLPEPPPTGYEPGP